MRSPPTSPWRTSSAPNSWTSAASPSPGCPPGSTNSPACATSTWPPPACASAASTPSAPCRNWRCWTSPATPCSTRAAAGRRATPCAALPNLRILNLARTGGEAGQYGDLGRLRNLHRLDLSGNRINNLGPLNLAGLNGLQRLALADNPLGNLDPAQLPLASVQSLDLSRAGLTLLRFKEDLPNLKELLLSGNRGLKLDEEYGDLFVLQALAAAEFDSDAQMPKGLKERLQRLQEQADRARRAGLKEAQQAAARAAGRGVEYQDAFLDGSRQGPVMVVIPGGEFQMGCSPGDGACSSSEGPPHRVRVKPFAIGKYEVSQAEWEAVMGDNPATFKAPDNPVGSVGWDDAQSFIAKLNQRTGKKYRLPTEAEWEYAARAATTTPYWWGSQASHDHANYGEDKCCGGYKSGKDQWENTAPVNSMAANPLGLHHILGNVWEWVQDCWHDNYQGAPTEAREWHENCRNADHRVFRGGSWLYYPSGLRSSNRSGNAASFRLNLDIGFRLAQDL